MEEGYVLDRNHGSSGSPSSWIEGAPERAWYGLKTKGRDVLSVRTFRCTRCGYLESYATEATKL
jgi:hypothetical protein